jgi:hypothetical protein
MDWIAYIAIIGSHLLLFGVGVAVGAVVTRQRIGAVLTRVDALHARLDNMEPRRTGGGE